MKGKKYLTATCIVTFLFMFMLFMTSDVKDLLKNNYISLGRNPLRNPLPVTSRQNPSPLHDDNNIHMDKSFGRNPLSVKSGQLKRYKKEKKRTHLYLLKTHKCGSSTISALLGRFGYLNNLTFVLPTELESPMIYLDREHGYLPEPKGEKYEILVHHSVYNRGILQKIFPRDTKYIGLIREPLARFVSAFIFLKSQNKRHVVQIPGKDTNAAISWYLKHTTYYTRKPGMKYRFLDNLMSFEYGFPMEERENVNDTIIEEFLRRIDAEFDLIIVLEYLDESLLLLKRMMFWSMKDIMFLKPFNEAVIDTEDILKSLTEDDRQRHKKLDFLDFALYNYFLKKIRQKIRSGGVSFQKELEDYQKARAAVSRFCENHKPGEELQYTTTNFKEHFKVNSYYCDLMNIGTGYLRRLIRQRKRYPKVPL